MRIYYYLDEVVKNTDEHLEGFAKDGLRTLCIAKRVCTQKK